MLVRLNTDLREGRVTLDAVSWGDFDDPKRFYKKGIMTVNLRAPNRRKGRGGSNEAAGYRATERQPDLC